MHCVLSCHEVFADVNGNTFHIYQVVQGVVQGVAKSQTQTQKYLSESVGLINTVQASDSYHVAYIITRQYS